MAIINKIILYDLGTVKSIEEKQLLAFAKHLKQLRQQYGFTQETLSGASGLDLSHIARIETARRNPKLTTLIILAEGMKIPLSELLDFRVSKK